MTPDEDESSSSTTTRTKPRSSLEEIINNDLAVTVISTTKSNNKKPPLLPIIHHHQSAAVGTTFDDSAVHDMIIRSVSSVHSSWSQDGIVYKKQPLNMSRGNSLNDKMSRVPSLEESFSSVSIHDIDEHNNQNSRKIIKTVNPILYIWIGVASTSLLALLSGLDATLHCTVAYDATIYEEQSNNDDMYHDDMYYDDFISEQAQREIEENFCISMFTTVILPTSIISILCAFLAVAILLYPESIFFTCSSAADCGPNNAKSMATSMEQRHMRVRERRRKQLCSLLTLSSIALIAWMYAIIFLMVKPPLDLTYQQVNQQINNYDDDNYNTFGSFVTNTVRNNQFQSLGAVNSLGQVGDNANLYYASWSSIGLSFALVYNYAFGNKIFSSKAYWRYSFYRLRERMGPWIVIFITCLLVLCSSIRIWRGVITPYKSLSDNMQNNNDDDNDNNDDNIWNLITSQEELFYYYYNNENTFIRGTWLAMIMGFLGCILSIVAIVAHWSESFVGSPSVPLALESTLVFLLILLLGILFNYVTCSGGPAQKVGNMYYGTMLAFILSFRIVMGCIEEIIQVHDPFLSNKDFLIRRVDSSSLDAAGAQGAEFEAADIYEIIATNIKENHYWISDAARRERKDYLRRWGTLAICSAVAFNSALDAARNYGTITHNHSSDYTTFSVPSNITVSQYWTIVAPSIVMILATIIFILCLFPRTYLYVYSVKIGGVTSFLTMIIWFTVIINNQHSHTSLAVNEHGEILTANLYYFTWACIFTCGINTSTYFKRAFESANNHIKESYMLVLWIAIMKVCFVVLSSSLHVYINIHSVCTSETNFYSSTCYRTIFAIIAGVLGEVVAFIAAVLRIFEIRYFIVVEAISAIFLAILYSFGAAYITGMSGPGQTVGDLYYATWLCFFVSLTIAREQLGNVVTIWNERMNCVNHNDKLEKDTNDVKQNENRNENDDNCYVEMTEVVI